MLTEPRTEAGDTADGPPSRPTATSAYLLPPLVLGGVAGAVLVAQAVVPMLGALVIVGAAAVALAGTSRRPLGPDHAGVTAWVAVASAVTAGLLEVADTRQHGVSLALAGVGLVGATVVTAWVRRERGDRPLRPALHRLLLPFEQPLAGWGLALVGAGMALPLVGSYSASISESDSAWLVVSTAHVRDQGLTLLERNQDVLLPHLVLSPLLDHGGLAAAVAFTILCTIALAAFTAVLAQRVTGSMVGVVAAVAALLSFPEVVARADRLPMYSLMLLLGYGGGLLLHLAMSPTPTPRWYPVAAGVAVMLSVEAHSVGQLFLLLPFLLLVLHPWSRAWRPLGVTVVTMLVVGIPRVVINLADGGLTAFRSNYTDFMIQRGYLRTVNRDFWGQNIDASPISYLRNLPDLARGAFGQMSLAPAVILAVLAGIQSRGRSRRFAIAAAGTYLLALVVASPGTYSRYLLPLSVGAAVVAGVGATRAVAARGERLVGSLVVGLLVLGATVNVGSYVGRAAAGHRTVLAGSWPVFAGLVDDGTAVLGVRSHELVWTDPNVKTEFSRTLSEADFVTYLTWPTDAAVLDVMDRVGAGWIFIHAQRALEVDYHQTWVEPAYGLDVRHVEQIAISDEFCLVAEIDGRRLYRRGGCPGGYLPGPYPPADLDGDGVPDALEPRLGLEPEVPADPTPLDPGTDGPELGPDASSTEPDPPSDPAEAPT